MKPAAAFPYDLAACDAMLAERDATIATKDGVIEQLEDRVEEQKRELAKALAERDAALQLAFRKRQERYLDDPNQFLLDFGDTADAKSFAEGIADAADEQEDTPARSQKRPRKIRNERLPEHLPRYEVMLDVPEDKKTCPTHGERKVIGYDVLETLEAVPAKLVGRRTLLPKFACPAGAVCSIVEARRPAGFG